MELHDATIINKDLKDALLNKKFTSLELKKPNIYGTSENGYFLFVGLEEDNYSAVAFQNNKIIGQQIFIAKENLVSYQYISSSTTPRSILVRAFDAFTGLPIDADVIAQYVQQRRIGRCGTPVPNSIDCQGNGHALLQWVIKKINISGDRIYTLSRGINRVALPHSMARRLAVEKP